MEFVSREHFDTYLRGLKYLGQGSQGACYLNTKKILYIKYLMTILMKKRQDIQKTFY